MYSAIPMDAIRSIFFLTLELGTYNILKQALSEIVSFNPLFGFFRYIVSSPCLSIITALRSCSQAVQKSMTNASIMFSSAGRL